jgi:hypothetical protein
MMFTPSDTAYQKKAVEPTWPVFSEKVCAQMQKLRELPAEMQLANHLTVEVQVTIEQQPRCKRSLSGRHLSDAKLQI